MRARHPRIPRQWLMTDERMGDSLWEALDRVPRGGGVIFRHYSLDRQARRALAERVARVAARRGLVLIIAGRERLGRIGSGVHGRFAGQRRGLHSWPAHNQREIIAARRAKAGVILISPVFTTRSHPGAAGLGIIRAALLARQAGVPVMALGGITRSTLRRVAAAGFDGWAGIDIWLTPDT